MRRIASLHKLGKQNRRFNRSCNQPGLADRSAHTAERFSPWPSIGHRMPDKVWTTASDNDGDEVAFELADLLSFAIQSRLHADAGALVLHQRGEEALPFLGSRCWGLGSD